MSEVSTPPASERSALPAEPRTIAGLWQEARGRAGTAYLVEEDDGWREVSWADAGVAIDELANGLLALGVGRGEAFAIIGRTRLEWALFDFALGLVGAVVAPIYPNSAQGETVYILEHSEVVGALVEDDEQLEKISEYRASSERLRHVLTFADLDGLREQGRAFAAANPGALAARTAEIDEDDLFTFIYTSGTTGPPKACMIRHRNYHAMVTKADEMEPPLTVPGDIALLYLPLAHNYGRLLHLSAPYVGFTVAFLPDPLHAVMALPQVRPTLFPSVPRVYEKIHTAVLQQFDEATGAKRRIIDWAMRVGYRVSQLEQAGEPVPALLAAQRRLAGKLVFSRVMERLGGRLRIANSGGAPLGQEMAEFFHAIGLLILEGYGLSECTTAATVNRPDAFRFGTVGQALPGVELRIADDGEVLIRSNTIFKGYYKDEASTAEVLTEDGWLLTGDVGEIDGDGFLKITDRKKDLIVTAGGKNVAPQNLENDLKASKYISQALVVGDRKPYVTALITLDEAALRAEGLTAPLEELATDESVRARIQSVIDGVNHERSRYEQVKRFAILPRDFTMEDDELTPTLKLKRRVCQQHFGSTIEELYG